MESQRSGHSLPFTALLDSDFIIVFRHSATGPNILCSLNKYHWMFISLTTYIYFNLQVIINICSYICRKSSELAKGNVLQEYNSIEGLASTSVPAEPALLNPLLFKPRTRIHK